MRIGLGRVIHDAISRLGRHGRSPWPVHRLGYIIIVHRTSERFATMMLVPSFLDRSPIHGIGIFSRDFIGKGARVWEFTPGFDQVFDERQLATLLPIQKAAVLFYCYVENGRSGAVLCCDNARHFNYADDPNCGPAGHHVEGYLSAFALRDILPGQELTYSIDEDDDADRKLAAGD